MIDINNLKERITKLDLDSYVIRFIKSDVEQLRFSNNKRDLRNLWEQEEISIFMNKGKKITEMAADTVSNLEDRLEKAYNNLLKSEDSESFQGINPKHYNSIEKINSKNESVELDSIVESCIKGAIEGGAQRATGLAYRYYIDDHIITPFNEHHVTYDNFNFDVRAFKGENTGQEGVHFDGSQKDIVEIAHKAGFEAGSTAAINVPDVEFLPGPYETLLSPYVLGNIFSYCSELFSAYSVQAGMSYLEESLGKDVASSPLTLMDEPLAQNGSNYTLFDDEGTPCFNKNIIKDGKLQTFLQSYSTAQNYKTETTGNAGVITPQTMQLSVKEGGKKLDDILSSMENGLYIKNAWYTRFQDDRNAVFSTVPRDGIFVVKDGNINGRIRGVRISDSFGRIMSNISELSRERKNVKFWEEVHPSIMPSALINDLNLTKAF
jgi:PmbA protein